VNGPNGLFFASDPDLLFIATEGSVAVNGEITWPGLPSQIVQVNTSSAVAVTRIFVKGISPPLDSLGFSSLVTLTHGMKSNYYVTDFGNNIYSYDYSGTQESLRFNTSYTGAPSKNAIGGLAIDYQNNILYTVGFINDNPDNPGAILRFDATTGAPMPRQGLAGPLFVPTSNSIRRPLGIIYIP